MKRGIWSYRNGWIFMLIAAAISLLLVVFSALAYSLIHEELRRFGQEAETLFAFRELYAVPVFILSVIAAVFFLVGLSILLRGMRGDVSS